MKLPRPDSLFARLLLLQVGVAVALIVVLGLFVYIERNAAIARLVGERWAPALQRAAGLPPTDAGSQAGRTLLRSDERPAGSWRAPLAAPRMVALDDELTRHGLNVRDAVVSRGSSGPVLWLQLRRADGTLGWFGIADIALLPRLPGRLALALLIIASVLAALSWYFTRRLTRPLEALRERMQSQRPGEPVPSREAISGATPEIAAIETAYDELLQRFERHERERALLLAGVSHDLRSPLARIRMAAGLLRDDAADARWREAIVRNTEEADRLIGSFLDHVRAGELSLDQHADLAAAARAAAAASGHAADELQVDTPAALPLSRTHPLLLERLVANLLDNAFKHGRAPVRLAVRAEPGRAIVEVSDAGAGVPEAQRESLQQAFARGDAARGTPGTGLGLAIVSRVVLRMGGTLAFERVDGRHVVRVVLPLHP
ncbi:ATP-binding protein [Variovorax sp. YR752]|uniref:ATP-binding protein n=1 Tax=Variovorax sp. YR752 TaxID=1884383 RepID=UPI0031380385